jgi:elongation factor G
LSEVRETALLWISLWPTTEADAKSLRVGLRQLMAEDPAIRLETGRAAGEVRIGGAGELHLEIVVDRLKREFDVTAGIGRPQVAYKETVTRPADGEMKYVGQADGGGKYGHVKIHLFPGEPGSGYVFEDDLMPVSIPPAFIKAIDEGIRKALTVGVVAGYPMDDVRIELYGGSYHDLDSSETAFRIAGSMAFQQAARKAKPVLLEPVMRVETVVPTEHTAEVVANLSRRRGQIQSQDARGETQIVNALVPLSEMFSYAADLRARTRGRGTFAMHLAGYLPCSPPGDNDGGRDSLVGAPRKPRPGLRDSRVALPEPDDDAAADRSDDEARG